MANNLERYADILYPVYGSLKHRRETALAVITAFVEDAAKEMCGQCERGEAVSQTAFDWFIHAPADRQTCDTCFASELREAAAKLLGEEQP